MEFQNQSATEGLLDDILSTVEGVLTEFANSDHFHSTLETSFGSDVNSEDTARLRSEFLNQDFLDNMELEFLPSATLNGALGAYARTTDSIYLSQNLLPQQASTVLLEEVGHAIDAQLNLQDSAGDEGNIFASLVEGETLTEEALSGLREEEDSAILTINSEPITVEQAELTVTNASDSGEGSLRQAIVQANETAGADVINFDSSLSGETISLTTGQLEITDALTINGLGSDELIISGNENSRIFQIDDSNDQFEIEVEIKDLTITEGKAIASETELEEIDLEEDIDFERGGAVFNQEALSVSNSRISNNVANQGGGITNTGSLTISNSSIANNGTTDPPLIADFANRGGIDNEGTLLLVNSAVTGNFAAGTGGIGNEGTLTLVNSTLSDNVAGFGGGGGLSNFNTAIVVNSTIAANRASEGLGGSGISNNGSLTLANTIIANQNNNLPVENETDIANSEEGTIRTEGVNLIEDGSLTGENILNQDPNLSSLQDNGGLTLTHAPFEGSPAIDIGENAFLSEAELEVDFNGDGDIEDTLETDQRGFDRIVNDTVDLGAVELRDGETPAPTTVDLSLDPTEGSEADQTTFTLTATASEPVSGEQTVALTTSGVDGDDFAGDLPSEITIADGETRGTVELTVNDDEATEGEETATFTLSNPSDGISLGANTSVEFIIADNDGEENLQGDFNDDGITNLDDLDIFAAAFGSVEGDSNYNATVDLTSDGAVNLNDLGELATFFAEEAGL